MSTLLETLSSYVPTLVVEQATQDPNYFTKPTKKKLSCVVLFADISGFTTLTERLAKRGPSGAEELTNLLNNYLGKLIDLITSYGGDIVKFAGDALLVLFTEEFIKEDLNKLTERVADCCLRVQKELHNYQVASDVELAIKLIINIGEVSIQTLGGIFGRWELLVTGDPLDQIALANSLAKAGEILLSSQAWELIKEKVEVINKNDKILLVNLRTNSYFPEIAKVQPKATATTAIRAFIPGAIRSRIDSGQTDWLAELRKITVLFINLPDLNHESLEKAQEAMCALQISLYRYEGSINKISVDDKGVSLVAAMGLPPLAHEDDPARGVRAAIAMQEELKKLGLQSSIGITTGQTFCGSVGSSVRREYTIIGDTVNLASRLMQVAQGSILTDKTTAKVASNRLNFTPLEPVTIKGKQQPITIYQPSLLTAKKSKTPSNPKTPIVGRINEIAFLKEKLLLSKQTCKCSSIIIEGEAGIGKSRLTEQLITQAQELELLTLTSEGDSIESSTPYFAWRNVVNQLFQLENLSDADKTEQQTHILRQLPNDAKTLQSAPLLDVFLPWDWVDNEYTAELIGKTRADAVHELLINLLKQASKNPLILVMEDAHWLDSGSWALLLLVCQQIENLITVIVTRPIAEPIPLEYKEIQVLSKTEKIVLNNLSVADTISLVCHRLGVNSLPKQVEDLIIEKSEGNPFFSEELAYVMRDLGFIEIINGECRLSNKSNELKTTKLP
ncbi:MAG: AAA family ATPase, partial [Blastocatellia bacterium]|nr:AAA family ATPase [Blastocatellia bacterium]